MRKTNLPRNPVLLIFLLTAFSITVFSQVPASAPAKQSVESTKQISRKRSAPQTSDIQTIQITAEQEKKLNEAAILLLDKAPVLTTSSDEKLEEKEFVTLTRAVALTETAKIGNSMQAIQALEEVIARIGNPTATLKSDPEKNDVVYRRYVDSSAPWESATTNTKVSVRPALYVFRCTNKQTGAVQEKTQSCTSNCTVEFKF